MALEQPKNMSHISADEKAVGEQYGYAHRYFQYRKLKNTKHLDESLNELIKLSHVGLNEMSCLEAGGSGNKSLALSRLGCKSIFYLELSEENARQMVSIAKEEDLPITVIHGSLLDEHP
jgi:hypothetical protein